MLLLLLRKLMNPLKLMILLKGSLGAPVTVCCCVTVRSLGAPERSSQGKACPYTTCGGALPWTLALRGRQCAPAAPYREVTESSEAKPKEEKAIEEKPSEEKPLEGSVGRDDQLARVETQKKMSLITAWEESEKCKVENKALKKVAAIEAWENTQKASVEAELKKIEEKLEKKKAEYAEKMKNKVAMIHKGAEEKKAAVEAKRAEDVVKVEELAAKYRVSGKPPKKILGFF
ncbi:Remorin [Bienertia sinuspersici]